MSTYFASITTPSGVHYVPYAGQSWTVAGGFSGPLQHWLVPKSVADMIVSELDGLDAPANEVTLNFGDAANITTVQRVVFLGCAPADNDQRRYLKFTDVRWYLTRAVYLMDVNPRRRVGDKRLIGSTLTDTIVVDTIAYGAWGTNNGVAYTWTALRDQTLAYLTTARHGRPALTWVADTFHVLTIGAQQVQSTTSDTTAELGLARAIESIPGAGIYVALNGTIHVYERTLGAEISVCAGLPPALIEMGSLALIDNAFIRPINSSHSWRVYFDYEIEVRLTYNPSGVGLWGTVAASDPYLEPVLQVTDQSLLIPAGAWGASRTVGQGTWITQAEAFAAWGSQNWGAFTLPQLTDDIVARHWFGDSLQRYTVGQTLGSYDALWGARIQELLRCYRTFFRVNPKFWDRVRHAWNVRAGIWDPSSGGRAPTPVYCNFMLIPYDRWASGGIPEMGVNHLNSYPTSGLLADGQPSGFRMRIEDEELGILEVTRDLSKFPGHTDLAVSPVQVIASINEAGAIMEACVQQLITGAGSSGWKLAVVISCAPAAPNDLRRCFEVQVDMTDVVTAAGLSEDVFVDGNAPDQEMRSRMAEARVAWEDDTGVSDKILQVFGAPDSTIVIGGVDGDPVEGLIPVNLEQELQPVAQAAAAADLLNKLNCYMGTKTVPQDKTLVPLGSITSVTHKVTEGRAVSTVVCERAGPPFNTEDFMKGSSREYVLKEIASRR